jgi:uncharacterized Zn finger protein
MENLIQPARPSISDATDVICEKCQNPYFIEVLVVKKISKILTGAEKDQIFQLPTLQCSKCGHVNTDFIPQTSKIKKPL